MFKELGQLAARHPWTICAAWLALGLTLTLTAPPLRSDAADLRCLPGHCTSVRAYQLLQTAFPHNTTTSAGTTDDMRDLQVPIIASALLVAVMLLLACRAPGLALVPILANTAASWIALQLLCCLTVIPGVHLTGPVVLLALVVPLSVGAGHGLFFLSRYREEFARGLNVSTAIVSSLGNAGVALAAAAGTGVLGFGLMLFAEFGSLHSAGLALALNMTITFIAAITLTPALLRLFGKLVFWPGMSPFPDRSNLARRLNMESAGLWDMLSRHVAKRPLPCWLLPLALLLPLAILGLHEKHTQFSHREGEYVDLKANPIVVLLSASADWTSREGLLEIDHLTRSFTALPNVAEVHSLTGKQGNQSTSPNVSFTKGRHITRLEIVLRTDPRSQESTETLELIKTWLSKELPRTTLLPGHIAAECHGVTAVQDDTAAVLESDRARIIVLLILALSGIMVGIVRRAGFGFHLLSSVLVTCCASAGVTVAAGSIWPDALAEVDSHNAPLVFAILAVVSANGAVLLLLRALEEKKRHGTRDGMRRALAQTGAALTWSGLIVAGALAAATVVGSADLRPIGIALGVGILLDALLLRPLVIPAFALLFWQENAPAIATPKKKPRPIKIFEPTLEAEKEPEIDDLYEWILASAPSAAP